MFPFASRMASFAVINAVLLCEIPLSETRETKPFITLIPFNISPSSGVEESMLSRLTEAPPGAPTIKSFVLWSRAELPPPSAETASVLTFVFRSFNSAPILPWSVFMLSPLAFTATPLPVSRILPPASILALPVFEVSELNVTFSEAFTRMSLTANPAAFLSILKLPSDARMSNEPPCASTFPD